ncbi:MAG: DUF1736 domain-containing protein [Planctomycetes bacterium]|nr:DUF1736 domain-containing protein [Planctomycetota bacterium]
MPGIHVAAIILLVAVVASAIFANALPNPFAIDDRPVIEWDARVRDGQFGALLTGDYWNLPGADPLYRPLVKLSYAINWALSPDPASFRAVNIALHSGASALLALLAVALFRSAWCALVSGLFFALHPLHTEALNTIVGRADLAVALLVLLAAVIHWNRGSPGDKIGLGRRSLVWLCFAAALGCKESGVVLPGVLMVMDWWRRHRRGDGQPRSPAGWRLRHLLRCYAPLLLVFGIYLAVRWVALDGQLTRPTSAINLVDNVLAHPDHGLQSGDSALLARWATPLVTFAKACRLMVWPAPLSHDYSYAAIDTVKRITDPRLPGAVLALVVVLTVCIGSFRRHGRLAVALGIGLVTYSLVSNTVLVIGTIFAERLLYLPSAGIALAVGVQSTAWIEHLKRGPTPLRRWSSGIALCGMAVLLGGFAYRTVDRNRDWRSRDILALADQRVAGRSCRLLAGVAAATSNAGDHAKALDYCRRAIEIHPQSDSAWRMAGLIHHQRDQNDEALEYLLRSFALGGLAHPDAVRAAAEILVSKENYEQANSLLTGLVDIYPQAATALNNLAWNLLTAQPTELRNPEQALAYAGRAIALEPDNVAFLDTFLHAQVDNGRLREAKKQLQRVLRTIPADHPLRPGLQTLLDRIDSPSP